MVVILARFNFHFIRVNDNLVQAPCSNKSNGSIHILFQGKEGRRAGILRDKTYNLMYIPDDDNLSNPFVYLIIIG